MKANFTRAGASGLRLLVAALISVAPLSRSFAQPTFIPDVQLRDYLNDLVPGCVDGSGYLDPAFPGVQQITELYPPSNCEDLTGLEQLAGVEYMKAGNLCVGCNTPEVLVFPPNLKHLWLENFYTGLLDGVVMLPPLPAPLLTLRINDKLLSDTIGFSSFPPALERLELVSFLLAALTSPAFLQCPRRSGMLPFFK